MRDSTRGRRAGGGGRPEVLLPQGRLGPSVAVYDEDGLRPDALPLRLTAPVQEGGLDEVHAHDAVVGRGEPDADAVAPTTLWDAEAGVTL